MVSCDSDGDDVGNACMVFVSEGSTIRDVAAVISDVKACHVDGDITVGNTKLFTSAGVVMSWMLGARKQCMNDLLVKWMRHIEGCYLL